MGLPENDRVHAHKQISMLDQSLSHLEAVESKLATDLNNLRSKIMDLRNQRSSLESRTAVVWSLPNELLSYIFELGVMDQEALDQEAAEDEPADEDNVFYKTVAFQVLVSHVCRMFRQVAIHTPSLWTQIYIFDLSPPRLDFVRTCVERSGTSRLDILLDTEDLRPTIEDMAFLSFTAILAPHTSRFKRFTARLRGFSGLHYIMRILDRPAPLLETLELSDIDYEAEFDENEAFSPSELRTPLTLFEGVAPKLRRLALDGAHVDWTTCNFKDLVELQLGYHTLDVRPSYDEFKSIIQASPSLQTLQLAGSAPLIPEDHIEPPLYMPIPMEQLTELTLSDIPSDYVTNVISLLHAPNLKSLALTDMDDNDYSSLVRKIAGPPAMFPALTALKIAAIEVHDSACEDLLRAYPTLTYLSLYFGRMSPVWLDILEPRGAEREVLCPKLECLRCVGASTVDVKRVLGRRLETGFKISRLELDQDSVGWATTGCMKWIKENVELETIVPSEHGSDDEDMNGTESEWATDDGGIEFPFFSMDGLSDMEVDEVEEDEDYQDSDDDETDGMESTDSTEGTEDSDQG